jgi:hypothetical protein
MRYFLYAQLLRWFGGEMVSGGYPMQGMVWLVGIPGSMAILASLFFLVYGALSWLNGKRHPQAGEPLAPELPAVV